MLHGIFDPLRAHLCKRWRYSFASKFPSQPRCCSSFSLSLQSPLPTFPFQSSISFTLWLRGMRYRLLNSIRISLIRRLERHACACVYVKRKVRKIMVMECFEMSFYRSNLLAKTVLSVSNPQFGRGVPSRTVFKMDRSVSGQVHHWLCCFLPSFFSLVRPVLCCLRHTFFFTPRYPHGKSDIRVCLLVTWNPGGYRWKDFSQLSPFIALHQPLLRAFSGLVW